MTATWFADERLAALSRERGEEPAIVEAARTVTWAELDGLASAVAALVVGESVAPRARVAILAEPAADTVAAILGVLRAGAVAAPLPVDRPARELAELCRTVDPALVLRLADVAGRGAAAAGHGSAAPRDPESAAVVVLTSGTTGAARGAVLSHRAMAVSADAWLAALPPASGWILALGLAHVAGLGVAWRALRDGVPVRIVPRDDSEALARAITADPPPTHVSLVPAQLARLLEAAHEPPATLRAVLLGGGPIPPALVVRALDAGWPVVPTYGLSEAASAVTALPVGEARDHPTSAGRPLPGVRVAIAGEEPDGVGEIVVVTPARFSGYLGEGREPAPPSEPIRTGDLGRVDAAGRLHVLDRRVDRIVRGGENVSPAEVEAVLLEHPAIAEAAVVARPDTLLGQVPVAALVLRPGVADPGDDALARHARASLAGFKVPAAWVRLDALPRTPGGKVRREAVRALLSGEATGELARPGGEAIGWRITGNGPRPVVLLHGTLSTAQQLDRLAQALAEPGDVTVHALDRRGSGSSRVTRPRPLDIAVHVEDLRAYLDARGIGRADVIGVSFGAVLALEAAARIPRRVRSVVAYEPPYGALADPALLDWFGRLAGATAHAHATGGPPAAAETFLRAVAGDAAWDRLPPRARAFLEAEGDGALADAGLTGLDPAGLDGVACPVVILTGGTSEPFYAPLADALAARVPGARRQTLPDLSHPAPITQPGAVAAAARAFLEPVP